MERHFSLHNRVFVMLSGMLQSGRIPHAILLEGLPGSGTQEAAVHLALSLNCHTNKGTDWACGDCMSCKKIRHGFHPDVHVIFPRTRKTAPEEIQETIEQLSGDPYTPHLIDEGNAILIDDVRGLRNSIYLKAFEGRYKVAILIGADRMNPHSGNALLRVLEEPPENSVLILTAARLSRVLPTIISRCIRVTFPRFSNEYIARCLARESELSEERAIEAASLSGGSLITARELCDEEFDTIRDMAAWLMRLVLSKPSPEDYEIIMGSGRRLGKQDALRIIEFLCFLIRLFLFQKDTAEKKANSCLFSFDDNTVEDMRKVFTSFAPRHMLTIVNLLEESIEMLTRNVQVSLVLFSLVSRFRENLRMAMK